MTVNTPASPEGDKSLNILMLAPTMFFADYGCHVRILEEAVILRKLNHHVTILAYPNGRDVAGINVQRSWGVPFNYRVIVGSSRHKLYLDALLALKALIYTVRHRPHLIHAHLHEGGLIGWVLSKLTGTPLVFDFQGSLTAEMLDHHFLSGPESWAYRPLRWLETRINHGAPVVLTSSLHAARLLQEEFSVPTGRIFPLPDCVNADTFSPHTNSSTKEADLKHTLGIPPERQIIVYLGLLTEYQGIGLLLEAVQALSAQRADFHLLLMGFPETEYRERAVDMGIEDLVTFTGKVPYEEAASYLALGDIAVAPKLSATEGSGKILNYMSLALPTVAFDTPVSREYLNECGIYASERTAPAFAEALNRVLDMPLAERQTLGEKLRQRVQTHYSWDDTGQRMAAIYEALIAGDPMPAAAGS
jgi:glycosyltransferase involved in cell wall biosynthesis